MSEPHPHNPHEDHVDPEDRPRPIRPAAPPPKRREEAKPISRPSIPRDRAAQAKLERRRTMIPILITLTILLPVLGIGWFALDADSPLKAAGKATAIALIVAGMLLFPLTILNMLAAKR